MLDDRSYMRADPHRSWWNATVLLIIAVTVCFALQEIAFFYFNQGPWIVKYLALSTEGLKGGFVWQLLSFQFLHVGFLHLFFNLLTLWFFGRPVEERLGSSSFLKLYFMSGAAGGLLQAGLGFLVPRYFGNIPTFGASAGICGVISAFALIAPHAEIRLWCVLPVKAKHLLWAGAGIALFFTLVPSDGGVAHAAHLGGYLAGIAYMKWDAHRPPLPWNPLLARRRKRQLVQTAAQVARWRKSDKPAGEVPPEEFISREVDPILDKISAHGIHSLTPRERQILEAARSKMAKR